MLALIMTKDWKVKQMDVKTTFFNGKLEEDVLMEIPIGFKGSNNLYLVCKLKRMLYSLC
jgi:hypothetical protein